MRKTVTMMLATAVFCLLLLYTLSAQDRGTRLYADDPSDSAYLPVALMPDPTATATATPIPEPTPWPTMVPNPDNPIRNPSFDIESWADVDNKSKQVPPEWELTWVPNGQPLYDSADLATGSCECVHKWYWQLPEHERPGGSDPLILSGRLVYKVFSQQAFGTQLSQTIIGLAPGSQWRLSVPLRVHLYGDTDPHGAEASVWVNNVGGWSNGANMGDRRWCRHVQQVTVPEDGTLQIDIRMKSKRPLVKDFFIDDLLLLPASFADPHAAIPVCDPNLTFEEYQAYRAD